MLPPVPVMRHTFPSSLADTWWMVARLPGHRILEVLSRARNELNHLDLARTDHLLAGHDPVASYRPEEIEPCPISATVAPDAPT
jgi:hypothetical protein